jgi:curved DNA-binding protein CbpA
VQGSLTCDHLPDILHSLARSEESGVLQVTRELTSKHIYFGRGSIVFARSNQHSDRLGEVLVREGRLTRAQLADASNKLRATGQRLGAVLVQMGILSDEEVRAVVSEQMRGMIRPVFSWRIGEYCFQAKDNPVSEDLAVTLSTIPTILEGTRDADREAIRGTLGDLRRVVSFSRDPWVHAHQVSLTPGEGFVLSRVDGQFTMAEIVSITPMDEEDTLRCLYVLVSGGFLEFGAKGRDLTPSKPSRRIYEIPVVLPRATPPRPVVSPVGAGDGISFAERQTHEDIIEKHASLARATFYDCLEVSRKAKDTELRKGYLAVVRKYHPDRHRSPHLRELHGMLQEILAKAADAYEALSDPVNRRRYDQTLRVEAPRGEANAPPIEIPPPMAPTTAETLAGRYFQEAKRYLDNRDFHQAVKLLEEVVELDPSKAEHHRTLAQALQNNPKWRKQAESHYRAAMKIDPFDLASLVGLGDLYASLNLKKRAKPLFAMALEIDPGNLEIISKLKCCK